MDKHDMHTDDGPEIIDGPMTDDERALLQGLGVHADAPVEEPHNPFQPSRFRAVATSSNDPTHARFNDRELLRISHFLHPRFVAQEPTDVEFEGWSATTPNPELAARTLTEYAMYRGWLRTGVSAAWLAMDPGTLELWANYLAAEGKKRESERLAEEAAHIRIGRGNLRIRLRMARSVRGTIPGKA
jgi:hypothetical protein